MVCSYCAYSKLYKIIICWKSIGSRELCKIISHLRKRIWSNHFWVVTKYNGCISLVQDMWLTTPIIISHNYLDWIMQVQLTHNEVNWTLFKWFLYVLLSISIYIHSWTECNLGPKKRLQDIHFLLETAMRE